MFTNQNKNFRVSFTNISPRVACDTNLTLKVSRLHCYWKRFLDYIAIRKACLLLTMNFCDIQSSGEGVTHRNQYITVYTVKLKTRTKSGHIASSFSNCSHCFVNHSFRRMTINQTAKYNAFILINLSVKTV